MAPSFCRHHVAPGYVHAPGTPARRTASPAPLLRGLGYLAAGCRAVSGEDGGHWASGKKGSDWDEPVEPLGRPGSWRGPRRPVPEASGPVLWKIEIRWDIVNWGRGYRPGSRTSPWVRIPVACDLAGF